MMLRRTGILLRLPKSARGGITQTISRQGVDVSRNLCDLPRTNTTAVAPIQALFDRQPRPAYEMMLLHGPIPPIRTHGVFAMCDVFFSDFYPSKQSIARGYVDRIVPACTTRHSTNKRSSAGGANHEITTDKHLLAPLRRKSKPRSIQVGLVDHLRFPPSLLC